MIPHQQRKRYSKNKRGKYSSFSNVFVDYFEFFHPPNPVLLDSCFSTSKSKAFKYQPSHIFPGLVLSCEPFSSSTPLLRSPSPSLRMRGIVASQHPLNSSGCHDLQTTCGNPISSQIRLRSRLGSGTFGSVYYGFLSHPETGVIEIALKTLHFSESFRSVPHPFTDDKMGAAQLLREIQTHASIPSHPSIVQYIGYIAQPDGLIALAMEYLRGGTLESFLYDPSSLISHFNSLSNSNLMEFLTSTKSAVQALLRFWNGKPKTNDLTLEIPKNSSSSSRLPTSFILFQFVEFINRALDLDRLMRSPEHTHCSEISGDLPRKNLIGGLAHNLLSLIHIALIGKPSKHPLLSLIHISEPTRRS